MINAAILGVAASGKKIGLYSQGREQNPLLGERESWITFVRQLVQKVVIVPPEDGKSTNLSIHGRLASILAAN